jgi:hypothetical protein
VWEEVDGSKIYYPALFYIFEKKIFSNVPTACLELIILFRRNGSSHPGIIGEPVVIYK